MEAPNIESITAEEAQRRHRRGVLLIDVRESDEHALGVPEGCLAIPRSRLEREHARHIGEADREVMLICGSGRRSMLAAETLAECGYSRLANVEGGFDAWKAADLPVVRDQTPENEWLERYSRHLRLPQVGREGQEKLQRARVVLVGAGGLGSPAAYYLAAAGVGHLRLVDHDRVDRSNLQRQVLHRDEDIGELKVRSGAKALLALNPSISVEAIALRVEAGNVMALIADADVVVDGSDNFPTRYLVNDACVRAGKPLVYGAVHRFEGQASVFDAGRRRGESPCYRCLFPEPPAPEDAPNCAEAGVLGVLPGMIGLVQATEAIKLILGIGESLAGRLLHFDALAMRFRETRLQADPACPGCGPDAESRSLEDLARICAGG
jgi:molybdopterin/thiamine biosynthesis adenylyltransferase